jgi:hypothetical protein
MMFGGGWPLAALDADSTAGVRIVFCTGPGCGCHYTIACPKHGLSNLGESTVTKDIGGRLK